MSWRRSVREEHCCHLAAVTAKRFDLHSGFTFLGLVWSEEDSWCSGFKRGAFAPVRIINDTHY